MNAFPRLEGVTEFRARPGAVEAEIREKLGDLDRLTRHFGSARAVLWIHCSRNAWDGEKTG